MGNGGAAPIIQTAGKERALVRDPKEMFESGDYATDVKVLMGANKHEGVRSKHLLLQYSKRILIQF